MENEVIERLDGVAASALNRATQIANDSRLSAQYRHEQIVEARQAAIDELRETSRVEIELLDAKRERLESQTVRPFAPDPAEAAQLSYIRDALRAQWEGSSVTDVLNGWRQAIQIGDLATARVYADFAPSTLRRLANGHLPGDVVTLSAETTRALLTPEQRDASDRLDDVRRTLADVRRYASRVEARIGALQFDPRTGEVFDGIRAATARNVRSMI